MQKLKNNFPKVCIYWYDAHDALETGWHEFDEIEKKSNNNSYKPNSDKFDLFKGDRFLYHLLSIKFNFDDSSVITKTFSVISF